MNNFSGYQSGMISLKQFRTGDYVLEGPIGGSINTYLATSKTTDEDKYILKKLIFTTSAERQACINALQQTLNSQTKGINLPNAYAVEYIDEKQNVLSLLYMKKPGSLKDEIEQRQRAGLSYFSTEELQGMVEYAFEQLFKLSTEKLYHLNIKPSNLLQNIRKNYSLSEGGYPSVSQCLDNEVFRSPEFVTFLSKKKPIIQLSTFDMEAADIFSLGLSFVQAATLLPTKDLKVFNDKDAFPQDAKDILDGILNRYGRDCYQLLSLMVNFVDEKRSNLEDIKDNELRNFMNSKDKPFAGGSQGGPGDIRNNSNNNEITLLQLAPEDLAFCRKIRGKCQEYCDRQRIILQDYFTKSDGYDKITKTITKYEFRRLLQTAGVTLEDYEIKSLNKALDPNDEGKFNLSEFLQESTAMSTSAQMLNKLAKDDLPQLSTEEEEVMLSAALKRAYAFIKHERVPLERLLKEEDKRGSGLLTFEQFKKILDGNGIVFREAEFNCIKIKFDLNFKKETINYPKFLEALNKTVTVSDVELREWQDTILKSIMMNFKSFDDFLIKQTRDNQSYMSFLAFQYYLEQDGMKVPENVLLKIKETIDPQNLNQIYVNSLKSLFQLSLESLIKRFVQDLANSLEYQHMSFSGFISTYLSKSTTVKISVFIEKCQDGLKLRVDRLALSFMLEFFNIQLNFSEEFQINKLRDNLQSFSKSNRINNAQQVFGDDISKSAVSKDNMTGSQGNSGNQSQYSSQKKDSSFQGIISQLKESAKTMRQSDILQVYGLIERQNVDLNFDNFKKKLDLFMKLSENEYSILFNQLAKTINNLRVVDAAEFLALLDVRVTSLPISAGGQGQPKGTINWNEIEKNSAFYIELNRLLRERNRKTKDHFYSSDKIVSRQFIEQRLSELGLKPDDFDHELDKIMMQLSEKLNSVDITKFIEVIDHFSNIAAAKKSLIENKTSIVWFIKIYKAINDDKANNFSISLFSRLVSGSDRINPIEFTQKISRDLRLNIDDSYKTFMENISLQNGDVSFTKFQEGYVKEEKAQRALADMRNMTQSSNKVISQAFSNIDINGDGLISKSEFLEMMPIINSSLRSDDLEYLYERLDLNNSGSISLDEFRDNILGKDALQNQQDFEATLKEFYREIQEEKRTFEDVFMNSVDKQMTTSELEKILNRIGFKLAGSKEKMLMMFEDLAFGGVIFNRSRLKMKYLKYSDSYREESLQRTIKTGSGQDKAEAMEFTRIIKQAIQQKKLYFDEVFVSSRKGYRKSEISNLLYDKLNLNTQKYQGQFDSFWEYFKEGSSQEIDFKLFEQAFKEQRVGDEANYNNNRNNNDSRMNDSRMGGSGRDNGRDDNRDVTEMFEKFLAQNAKDCEDQFEMIHSSSITIGELLECVQRAGFRQTISKRQAEDYCASKGAIKRNGEVDYPLLLETIRRSNRSDPIRESQQPRGFQKGYGQEDRDDKYSRDNDNNNNNRDRRNSRDNYNNNNNNRDDYNNNNRDNYNNNNRDNYNNNNRDNYNNNNRDNNNNNRDPIRDSRFRDNNPTDENDRNFNNTRGFNNQPNDKRQQFSTRPDRKDYNIALQDLLDQMIQKKVNILDLVKIGKLDRNNEGLADNRQFWEEMRQSGVRLSSSSQEAIEEFAVTSKGFIEYKKLDGDIRANIEEQKKANHGNNPQKKFGKHKKMRMKKEEIQRILSEFKQDVQKFIKDKSVGIRYAFKRFDKDNDGTISFTEFEKALNDSRLLPFFDSYKNRDDKDSIIENLFDIFDEDKELKIDLPHFQKFVYPEQSDIDIAPLMMQFKSVLKSTSEEDLRKQYELIDADNDGQISYSEFQRYIKQITKGTPMKDVEIERLFQHFLQDKSSDKISFEHFVAVVQDDHMNFEKIRKKIIEYREKNSVTLKSIYDKHAGAKGTISLQSLQMFFQVLKLEFSMDQLDELFSFLDSNGDGMISYDEFYNAIEKAEINYFQLLKRMRREFVNSKCDVPTELKNKANGRDTVSFTDFKSIITQFKVEIKPFELDALYKKYGKDDMIRYMDFLNDLLFNKCDIETIKKKVIDYTTKENISLVAFFGFFSHNNDAIILPEFQQLLLACEANIPKDEVLEAFSAFDMNNNGSIQKDEFIAILQGKIIPQASIGYQFMLQNAQSFQPVNQYMDASIMMTSSNPFANMGDSMTAQSMYVNTNYFQQNKQMQQQQQQVQSQIINQPFQGGQQQQYLQQQQGGMINQQNNGNLQGQGEINLPVSCTVEEIIDTIGQECQKRRIRVFYLFVIIDQAAFTCIYENEQGLELIMKELRINVKGTHYDKLFKRFYVQEKKGLGYMNILKEILGLRQVIQLSMLYSIRQSKSTLNMLFDRLSGKGSRQIQPQSLLAYATQVLNILPGDNNSLAGEIDVIFNSIIDPKTRTVGIQELASFLAVTTAYNGAFDKIDYIDVKNSELGLRKIEDICKTLQVSIIDLFSYFDKKNLYKLKLENFEELLENVDLRLSTGEVRSIYQQYATEEEIQILQIVKMIEQPNEMFKKICIKVMACNGLSFEEFFAHFSVDGKFSKWRNQEIKSFYLQFNLFPTDRELLDLFLLIAQKKSDIYPQDLAGFLGIQANTTAAQVQGIQENIVQYVRQLLQDYRNNRQALLSRLAAGTQIPQQGLNQMYQQQQQQQLFQQQQQGQYNQGYGSNVLQPAPLIPPQMGQNSQLYNNNNQNYNPNNNNNSMMYQNRMDAMPNSQQRQLPRSQFATPIQQQQQQMQQYDQRGNNIINNNNNTFGNNDSFYNNNNNRDNNTFGRPIDQQYQQQQQQKQQQQPQYSAAPVPNKPVDIDKKLKDKQTIDNELKRLGLALEQKGGQEIINLGGRDGQIHFNQLEQVLMRQYGFFQSPDFNMLLDNLVDSSGFASIQGIFNKVDYDHQKFIRSQEINKSLGVGLAKANNSRAPVARDELKVNVLRKQLLDIYNQDFAALSETFFQQSPFLDAPQFLPIAKGIFNGRQGIVQNKQQQPQNQQQQQEMQLQQNAQLPTDIELEGLFDAIDGNGNGLLTYNEFEQFFVDDPQQLIKRNNSKFKISPQMEKDIQDLFSVVDINGDKQISIDELNVLFQKIGQQASQTEIDEYLRRYDKNGDKTLSFDEFKMIMEEKIKNEMLTSESVIDELKREFKKVDMNNTRMLNIGQLGQVLRNLGSSLKPAELSALFNEIDVDGSRTVDIDELVAFISRNQEGSSSLAQTAVLNIRLSRKFSIRDLLDTFKQMPANYRLSAFRSQLQKCNNLPSSTLKPRLSASLTYPDLYYGNTTLLDPNMSVLDHKREPSQFLMELSFRLGTGIPLPDEASFPRESIVKRIAYVSFYDSNRSTFIGNTCRLVASWTPEYEDRWVFENKTLDQIVFARYVGYDKARQQSLSICVELVMHYLPKNCNSKTDLEISVSHVMIPLGSLNRDGENIFKLQGGDPSNPVFIDPADVRTKRTGFKTLVKALSKKIDSTLIINISTKVQNLQLLNDIVILPDILIFRKNCLPFYTAYREYFGYRSICKKEIDIDLPSDPIFKTFAKTIDCPDTHGPVCDFWRFEVLAKYQQLNDLKSAFVKTMNHLYQVFSYEKFYFNQQDPTGSVNCFVNVLGDRRRLLSLCFEDLRIIIGLKQGTAGNLKIADNTVPFSIEELLDDNEEDDNIMMEEFIKRKAKSGFISTN